MQHGRMNACMQLCHLCICLHIYINIYFCVHYTHTYRNICMWHSQCCLELGVGGVFVEFQAGCQLFTWILCFGFRLLYNPNHGPLVWSPCLRVPTYPRHTSRVHTSNPTEARHIVPLLGCKGGGAWRHPVNLLRGSSFGFGCLSNPMA